MTSKKDFVQSAITEHLAPVLSKAGFCRYRPKHFLRIRGEMVDSIGFQMSKWGGRDFYVHYYINLLSDPLMDIDTYRIGKRVDAPPDRDINWAGPGEEAASIALQSVTKVAEDSILPWFESVGTVRDFVVEYVAKPDTQLDNLDLSIALLHIGFTNRPWWSCEIIKDAQRYSEPLEAHEQAKIEHAVQLQQAIDSAKHEELLALWRRQNVDKFKLASVSAQPGAPADAKKRRG